MNNEDMYALLQVEYEEYENELYDAYDGNEVPLSFKEWLKSYGISNWEDLSKEEFDNIFG